VVDHDSGIELAPVQRVADNVSTTLRQAVLSGRLEVGQKLSVPALAQELGVSRSPVREAVARLIAEGLAVEIPRRGAVVRRLTEDDLAELYEVREALEGVVARLAVQRGGPDLPDRLDEVLAAHSDALDRGDLDASLEHDTGFHALIRRAAQHDYAARLLDQIQSKVVLAMRTTMVTAGPHKALEDHRGIAAAVRLADAELAERRARLHIVRLRDALRLGGPDPATT